MIEFVEQPLTRADNRLHSIDGTGEESVVNATEDDVEDPSNRIVEILIFD